MALSTEILADSPEIYWQFRDASTTVQVDASGNGHSLDLVNAPATQQASLHGEVGDYSILLDDASSEGGYRATPASMHSGALTAVTLEWVGSIDDPAEADAVLLWNNWNAGLGAAYSGQNIYINSSGNVVGYVSQQTSGLSLSVTGTTDIRDGSVHHVVLTCDGTTTRLYIDGNEEGTAQTITGGIYNNTSGYIYVGCAPFAWPTPGLYFMSGNVCEAALYKSALSLARIQAHAAEVGFSTTIGASSIPMSLKGFLEYAAAAVPMRLQSLTQVSASSIPMNLQSADPAHYLATAAKWGAQVILDGGDISARLVEAISINFREDEAGTAVFKFKPTAGAVDLNDFERKAVKIDFLGKDAAGLTTYQVRRFTGITTTARIDIDQGIITVEATNDLQGHLENMDKDTIADILGGEWSPHVFNEDADGWQYARDRMSTQTKEMHIDAFGYLRTVDWEAKATPDITFTDGERFNNTLNLNRVNRRELLSQVVMDVDFRFNRLRHRAIQVTFPDGLGFCSYLNQGWTLPQREMIRAAADGNTWVRTSPVSYIALPGPLANVCIPPRAWAGGADEFCLGAYWQAARRWKQYITEKYSLTIKSVDIEQAIGQQSVNEAHGVEATYDATDYEAITDYTGPPASAVFDAALQDYVEDADDAEHDGRLAMEQAQTVLLAKGKAEILGRARKNIVSFGSVYHPDLTLERTVRVQTPYLTAKGKVHAYTEELNLKTGYPRMLIDLAISRHGGSGIGVNDPLTPAAQPSGPAETPTSRVYYIPYRLGGTINAPQDNADWDGYMTNVIEAQRDPSGGVYEERFVVRMPEIEETARTAVDVQQPATYEVAVPEDQLTLSV